ncbi:fibroblast growth factor 8 [Hydra vulgaris]|uniref:Fibroblast growth factor 8 n=1 Tax=Hydra vulgaris TaxID=6087 RepID=A0ABM4D2K0_HYDVU
MLGNIPSAKFLGVCLILCCPNLWTMSLVIPRKHRIHTPSLIDIHETPKKNEIVPTANLEELSNITKKDDTKEMTSDQPSQDATSLDRILNTILSDKTNARKVYLRSKIKGFYLKMNNDGHLSGTHDISDKKAIFIIETMTRGVVRIKSESTGKYICINQNGKLVTKAKPILKCLLRQYFEENYYHIFWSYKYSRVSDGESGWLLALRDNGKIKRPSKTKLGDNSTFFFIQDAQNLWLG